MLEILQLLLGLVIMMVGAGFFLLARSKKTLKSSKEANDQEPVPKQTQKIFDFPVMEEEAPKPRVQLPEVIVYYLLPSTGQTFNGLDLYRVFTDHGVVFGDQKIFHCLEDDEILFSVAKSEEPGIFDEQLMKETSIPGLALFCQYKTLKDPSLAYERMMNLAYRIARELGGQILTPDRQSVHHETVELMIAELSRLEVGALDEA
ncbi:MAG: cell division protein ZipA C-terminal FtsZ-binding domain-containing protein [Candidatus Comchoanobacterales bacterium]